MDSQSMILERLTSVQFSAWQYVVESVKNQRTNARDRVLRLLRDDGCPQPLFDTAMDVIRHHARVVLHFHPDRIGTSSGTVIEGLLKDGLYLNQFETGLSSGSATAYPGGPRDEWERTLFGGAYHHHEATLGERPKYGALELIRYADGPLPRFGSCYFVLRPEVAQRTSFTFSGSEQPDAPERLGTMDCLEGVLVPLFVEVASGKGTQVPWPPFVAPTLGVEQLTISGLLEMIVSQLPDPRPNPCLIAPGRVLDTGIEAQVHGPIDLVEDVELLVADPAFRGTRTGNLLIRLCQMYGIALAWHCGFRMAAAEVPEDFRGSAVSKLAIRIAQEGFVDAAVIGAAQQSLRLRPQQWQDCGTAEDTLQHLKQLWHVLVHYGVARERLSD